MKPKTIPPLLLAVLLLSVAAVGLPAADVGKVESFSGTVLIDTFGKSAFIPAVKGDLLYETTALRTGRDGRASIVLEGNPYDIPPSTEVRVADLLAVQERKKGLPWFKTFGHLVRSLVSTAREEEDPQYLADRDERKDGPPALFWMTESEELASELRKISRMIQQGAALEAVIALKSLQVDGDAGAADGVAYLMGSAYFQLGDYAGAARLLADAQSRSAFAFSSSDWRVLTFELGASRYLLGQERDAIPLFEELAEARIPDQYDAYAWLFLAKARAAVGDTGGARNAAVEGLRFYQGTDLEVEFLTLLAEL